MGQGASGAQHPCTEPGVGGKDERRGEQRPLEIRTPREPLKVTLNREDCQSPGTEEKYNTGASRQRNLEVQGKENKK